MKQMDRRSFLGAIAAISAASLLPKKIYCFAPPCGWNLADSGIYTYRYTYRNSMTGHVSDPVIKRGPLCFLPYDLIDIWRKIRSEKAFEYIQTEPLKYPAQIEIDGPGIMGSICLLSVRQP